MNSQDLQGLQEAYSEVTEGMTMKDFKQQRSRQKQKDKRESEKTSPLRRTGIHDDKASPERAARHRANVDPDYDYGDEEQMYPGGKLKDPKKIRKAKAVGELTKEEYIDEAEGSYGQTPTARKSYGDLANKRRNTPASEYPQRGDKKVAVKSAQKHFDRTGNPDAGDRSKKSTKPDWGSGKRKGMTQSDRDHARGEAEYGHTGYDPDWDGPASGPGGKPKGKKAERQKKTGVSAESFNAYELVLSYLLDEGFASTTENADKIILNMSESWFENIMELNRYEKETGKDYKTGKEVTKGGTMGGDDTHSKVMRHMHKVMGSGRMGAGGGIQPRGKKKVPGEKKPSTQVTPAEKVSKRRADAQRTQDMMHSRFD